MLVPQVTYFGVITLLAIIVASGRLLDAVTDPVIAYMSDKSTNKKGRRIPFMKWALLPSVLFCVLIFIPVVYSESELNLWWLAFAQAGFYLALTAYIVPYNALLPELAQESDEKVTLSALLSVGFVLGIILSAQTPLVADQLEEVFNIENRNIALQWAIVSFAALALVFMFIPVWYINESKHGSGKPTSIPLNESLQQTFSNKNFFSFCICRNALFYFTYVGCKWIVILLDCIARIGRIFRWTCDGYNGFSVLCAFILWS